MKHLTSPWVDSFDSLLEGVTSSLVMCSPYVGRGPCRKVANALRPKRPDDISVFVLTDLSRDTMLSGATDVAGLIELAEALPQIEIRFLPRVHAKAYVADERQAVVTSGNLTESGLSTNFEYGLFLSDEGVVKQVKADILAYGSLGSRIEMGQLRLFDQIVSELKEMRAEAERSMRGRLRAEFTRKLVAADLEILRARAEGLSPHAAFADTILYILGKGPATTKNIYSRIQHIHPDLCDDTIKLVIKGETWSQVKWHHRVRHAQLFLKRQGRIQSDGSGWRLVG